MKAEAGNAIADERTDLLTSRPPRYSDNHRPNSRNSTEQQRLPGSPGPQHVAGRRNINGVELVERTNRRSYVDAYLLCLMFGLFGAHHFYLRRSSFGVIYLCTLGLCGVGWLVDIFRVPFLVARSNRQLVAEETDDPRAFYLRYKKELDDAYLLAFPLGFLGIHRFYLGQPLFGFLYALTCGLFVIGWLLDLLRLPRMVKDYNWRLEQSLMSRTQAPCPEYDERRGGARGVGASWPEPLPAGGRWEGSARRVGSAASWDVNSPNSRQNPPYYHYCPATPVHVPTISPYETGKIAVLYGTR